MVPKVGAFGSSLLMVVTLAACSSSPDEPKPDQPTAKVTPTAPSPSGG